MLRIILAILAALLFPILQVTLMPALAVYGAVADIAVGLVIALAFHFNLTLTGACAIIAGATLDGFLGTPGLYIFCYLGIGLALSILYDRRVLQHPAWGIAAAPAFVLLRDIGLLLFRYFSEIEVPFSMGMVGMIALEMAMTALAAWLAYLLFTPLSRSPYIHGERVTIAAK